MDGKPLEALTRIARNLPVPKTTFKRTKTPEGEVYYAYGRGLNWHGVYAFEGPGGEVARTMEYRGPATGKQIQEILIVEARKELAIMNTTCKQ